MDIKKAKQKGAILIYLIIIILVFLMIMFPIVTLLVAKFKLLATTIEREQALQIAEAGINYYEWHLAHFVNDYEDRTNPSTVDPNDGHVYTIAPHEYKDFNTNQTVGDFDLTITAPIAGSTIVTIKSNGYTTDNPNIKRTVTVQYGIQSLAKYAFLSDANIWLAPDETVNGPLMSNNGVRFDGHANALIESTKSTYSPPWVQGTPCSDPENGVWCCPRHDATHCPAFSLFHYGPDVPNVPFGAITTGFQKMQDLAQNHGGIDLGPSGAQGYSLVFNSDGTFTVYKVTALINLNTDDNNPDYDPATQSAGNLVYDHRAIPANGIIFVEDNVWVEGIVKGRATVAAANLNFGSTPPTIYIPHSIVYGARDGSDVLGLIAQNNIYVTYGADDVLVVDGALIAQEGAVIFPGGPVKTSITTFGTVMTYNMWTWTWEDGQNPDGSWHVSSGYAQTYNNYDSHLLYGPPPSFPVLNSTYQVISWTSD